MVDTLHICSLAAMTYVVTGLMVSAVRWFHVCHPFDKDPDYYFPGRRAIMLFFLSSLLLLPYVFLPENPWAWMLVKAFFLPFNIYFLTLMLFSYFGSVRQWRKWRLPAIYVGVPTFLALGLVLVLSLWPQSRLEGGERALVVLKWIVYGLGVLMTVLFLFSIKIVYGWVQSYDESEYSNPDDFPVPFARKVIALLFASVALLWVAALVDRPWVMAVLHVVLAVFSAGFLIAVLHPHRHRSVEEEEDVPASSVAGKGEGDSGEAEEKHTYSYNLTPDKTKTIIAAIRKMVVKEKAFLNPHLSLQDVATQCGFNRTYVSRVFKTELGGFFSYVNNLRLDYAEAYQKEHPDASIHEIATESGFSSRQTYYSVKSRLRPSA